MVATQFKLIRYLLYYVYNILWDLQHYSYNNLYHIWFILLLYGEGSSILPFVKRWGEWTYKVGREKQQQTILHLYRYWHCLDISDFGFERNQKDIWQTQNPKGHAVRRILFLFPWILMSHMCGIMKSSILYLLLYYIASKHLRIKIAVSNRIWLLSSACFYCILFYPRHYVCYIFV